MYTVQYTYINFIYCHSQSKMCVFFAERMPSRILCANYCTKSVQDMAYLLIIEHTCQLRIDYCKVNPKCPCMQSYMLHIKLELEYPTHNSLQPGSPL